MSTQMIDETRQRELLARAREGDQDALSELFGAHRDRLLASVRGRLGPDVRHSVDPEDVLQDAFVRAFHSLDRFEWRGEHSLRRWLESIATHIVLDAVRHQRRRKVLKIDREPPADAPSPSRGLRRRERSERLKESLESLSADHRTVLTLSRLEGLSIAEVAERMGRSESAVKNLLLRATRELKRSFGDTESLRLDDARFEGGRESDER